MLQTGYVIKIIHIMSNLAYKHTGNFEQYLVKYLPKGFRVKLKERTKIVAGPSEFLISIIIVATSFSVSLF